MSAPPSTAQAQIVVAALGALAVVVAHRHFQSRQGNVSLLAAVIVMGANAFETVQRQVLHPVELHQLLEYITGPQVFAKAQPTRFEKSAGVIAQGSFQSAANL